MKARFTLTYSVCTEESSRDGDFAYAGYVTRDGRMPRKRNYIPKRPAQFTLRQALGIIQGHNFNEGVQCDSCPWSPASPPRWVSFLRGWDMSGETLELSLHPAKRNGITGASMCRIARLFGAYGERRMQAAA